MLRTISLLALFPATLCAAECPTASNLARGIEFSVDASDTETHRAAPNGFIETVYTSDGGSDRFMLAKGLYLVELAPLKDGKPVFSERTIYGYPIPAQDLPLPTLNTPPGTGWNMTVAIRESGDMTSELQVYSIGLPSVRSYGACQYQAIPIVVRYLNETDDDITIDHLDYLPELGTSLLVQSTYGDSTDVYKYRSIRALP